jgi:enediyne biosynthesis protein E4
MRVTPLPVLLRRHVRPLAALGVAGALFGAARLPSLPAGEREALASRFVFEETVIPTAATDPHRSVRAVHPSLRHIDAWISSVGAAVALNDLDGDGRANDLCAVDPRTDAVTVAPVPGTGARYAPFLLDPRPLPYDPATMAPMGCLPADLTGDGALDLVVYYWGRTPVAYLRRGGAPDAPPSAASYVPREVVAEVERWYTNAATFADVDGDGHPDLVVGNYFPDGARVLDAGADGSERMQHSMSRARNGGRNRVLLWGGARSGTDPAAFFQEAPEAFDDGISHGWTLALGAADLDGDHLPELYLAEDFGPDALLHNRSVPGRPRFVALRGTRGLRTPKSKILGRDSFKGMGVDFADLNGDGWLDIFVSNIAAEWALQESHFTWLSTGRVERMRNGIAPYRDRSEPLGLSRSDWSWDARMVDFDNDGVPEVVQATGFVRGDLDRWPELHEIAMGNDQLLSRPRAWHRFGEGDDLSGRAHNRFFARGPGGRYHDVAAEVGMGRAQVSRGIAVADVDGDGRLDLAVANQWEPSRFYRNVAPAAGAFLGLHVHRALPADPDAHRVRSRAGHPDAGFRGSPAIGARAVVHLPTGERRVAQVDGGTGHSGKRSHDLHFGIGAIDPGTPLRVDLHWRGTDGVLTEHTVFLTPGWHTVVLAARASGRDGHD